MQGGGGGGGGGASYPPRGACWPKGKIGQGQFCLEKKLSNAQEVKVEGTAVAHKSAKRVSAPCGTCTWRGVFMMKVLSTVFGKGLCVG